MQLRHLHHQQVRRESSVVNGQWSAVRRLWSVVRGLVQHYLKHLRPSLPCNK